MKKILFCILLIISELGSAQTKPKFSMGGFGGPLVQIGESKNSALVWVGGGGGCIIQKHIFFGGFGESTVNELKAKGIYEGSHLELSHGGFWLGYIQPIGEKSNIFLSSQIGFGTSTQLKNADVSYYSNYTIIKPSVEYEFVFTNFFKVGAGLSWSLFKGADLPVWSDNSLSGLNFMISFKLGWF